MCVCTCMVYGCVCVSAGDQSQSALQSPWVSASCSSLLPDRIEPLGERTCFFLIGHQLQRFCSAQNLSGPSLTLLSPRGEWYLGGSRLLCRGASLPILYLWSRDMEIWGNGKRGALEPLTLRWRNSAALKYSLKGLNLQKYK